jgi:hypothetical protein
MSISKIHLLSFSAALLAIACDTSNDKDDVHPGDDGADGADGADDDGDDDGGDDGAGAAEGAFFLPTGEPDNTAAPVVEIDAEGGIHAVYPAYAGGDAYYAYCDASCSGSDDVKVVRLPTDGTVANAMLALDADGRPQVLLSTFAHVDYATCDGDCTTPEAWTISEILVHDGDHEVSGEAFALDPEGRPRFMMHAYAALFGIGQGEPMTEYVTCDDDCHDPESWSRHKVADQIWRSTTLRFDPEGRARVATSAMVEATDTTPSQDAVAYVECNADCEAFESWIGVPLEAAFTSLYDAVEIDPTLSMALTRDGSPRLIVLAKNLETGARDLRYLQCDESCTEQAQWGGVILVEGDDLGAGLDLALDAEDHPRFVHTWNYDIGIGVCDEDRCDTAEAPWHLYPVERGAELPPDDIFLWENCTVGAWFLHSPSIALDPQGRARVGYQARDISGGFGNPDPVNTPDCEAGTDMTWSRLAMLGVPE